MTGVSAEEINVSQKILPFNMCTLMLCVSVLVKRHRKCPWSSIVALLMMSSLISERPGNGLSLMRTRRSCHRGLAATGCPLKNQSTLSGAAVAPVALHTRWMSSLMLTTGLPVKCNSGSYCTGSGIKEFRS